MTPTEITALVTAAGALATAISMGIANIITASRANRKMDISLEKQDTAGAKLDVIGGHVNSSATEYKTKIDALNKQVEDLRHQLVDSRIAAATMAQARADAEVIKPVVALVTPKVQDDKNQS